MPEIKGTTSKTHKLKLESKIMKVLWTNSKAAPGATVGIDVVTQFVGNNSEVQIEISDKSGAKFETIKTRISGNKFRKEIIVPEKAKDELFAEVKLNRHGLSKKSNPLLLFPAIQIKNAKWDKAEAQPGDIIKLTAEIIGVMEGTEAVIEIWEYDSDGANDLCTKFPVIVKKRKVEVQWEYQFYDPLDTIVNYDESEKGYQWPQYFFRVKIAGVTSDSDMLKYKDWIEFTIKDKYDQPLQNKEYLIILPDGSEKKGKTDESGHTRLEHIPPGKCKISFPT